MRYCGLDIASSSSYFFVVNEKGRKLSSGEVATHKQAFAKELGSFESFLRNLNVAKGVAHFLAYIFLVVVVSSGILGVVAKQCRGLLGVVHRHCSGRRLDGAMVVNVVSSSSSRLFRRQ